jgi:hypothetical protein
MMSKIKLSDSGMPVRKISVIWLCRDSKSHLYYLFDTLAKIEKTYECEFEYFIAENGSSDNTHKLLRNFLHTREGRLITLGNTAILDRLPRIERIAKIRNILLDSIRPLNSDWVLLLDMDVYFQHDILANLLSLSPSEKQIGMLCAYGIEGLPKPDGAGWITQFHYYDTYAFLSCDNHLYWPHCIFAKCEKCSSQNPNAQKINNTGIVKVNSAFGGLALIKSQLLNHPDVQWKTMPLTKNADIHWDGISKGEMLLCEHIYFCKMLRQTSGLSVAIACDAPVYWDFSSRRPYYYKTWVSVGMLRLKWFLHSLYS